MTAKYNEVYCKELGDRCSDYDFLFSLGDRFKKYDEALELFTKGQHRIFSECSEDVDYMYSKCLEYYLDLMIAEVEATYKMIQITKGKRGEI